MNKEQQMFLNIVSDHLHGRETTMPSEELDWLQINKYAKSHQIEGMVNHQLHGFFADKYECINIVKQMEQAKMACVFTYVSKVHALNEIQNAFQTEHICFFAVKGLEIASCYPIPAYRTMGDLDLVVIPKDKMRARKSLEELGYLLIENNYGLQYKKNNINLELDDHLLHKESLENNTRRVFFDTCWKYLKKNSNGEYQLDNSFHYIYLVEHTKKHFRTRGVGFRQFIDIAVFVQKHSDLDWDWIKIQLNNIKLLKFAILVHTFINKWWGIESPFENEPLKEDFFDETTDYVFDSGVFGFDNNNHSLYVKEANMNSDRDSGVLSDLLVLLKQTFISYEKIIKLPYCSFLIEKKWLLPFGWLYRVIYILKSKKEHWRKQNLDLLESQEIMDKHRRLMERWGI